MEDSLITWLLVAICSPQCIKNPYMVAKMIEVLFVINPGIQARTEVLHLRVMAHPIAAMHLPSCLMKFYTGETFYPGSVCVALFQYLHRSWFSVCTISSA